MDRTGWTLSFVFSNLSEAEARACYDALAQWADNERNGLGDPEDSDYQKHEPQVKLVEGVVEKLELALTSFIDKQS